MNGYYKIRIMDHNKTWFDCWQAVLGGNVVGYVNDDGVAIELPELHDAAVLEKTFHKFIPGHEPPPPPPNPAIVAMLADMDAGELRAALAREFPDPAEYAEQLRLHSK